MVKTSEFVYILILFICIFLVMIVCDSAYLPFSRSCITNKDCPQVKNFSARCRKGYCQFRVLR